MLELRPLKTFGKMWSSPYVSNMMNVHMSSQRSQDPLDPGPLTSSTEKDVVPRSDAAPLSTLCSCHLLRLEVVQFLSRTFASPLRSEVPNDTAKVFTENGLLHGLCRE